MLKSIDRNYYDSWSGSEGDAQIRRDRSKGSLLITSDYAGGAVPQDVASDDRPRPGRRPPYHWRKTQWPGGGVREIERRHPGANRRIDPPRLRGTSA